MLASIRNLMGLDGSYENISPENLPQPVPLAYPIRKGQRARTMLSACFLASSAYFGSVFFHGVCIPLVFFAPTAFCFLVSACVHLWTKLVEVPRPHLLPIRLMFTARHPLRQMKPIRQQVWMDGLLSRGMEELGNLPGAGWAMHMANFIFLQRKIAADEKHMKDVVDYLLRLDGQAHEVHYYVRRWPVSSIIGSPAGDSPNKDENNADAFGAWLNERWLEKEQLLKDYYRMHASSMFSVLV
ncbi:unnamed protein product [Dibothriocephalus latus]|uniref:Uncharacterized protein n=1 Tax=Dibothriocephalus latus TaxID=60516 RepID=A0A3P7KWD1_DIBLA|nr:unnamed protein product [Dibothriocephalus latus]